MVSADHYISQYTSIIWNKRGKLARSEMFSAVGVFVDHVSGFMGIKHKVEINYTEIIKAKLTFER